MRCRDDLLISLQNDVKKNLTEAITKGNKYKEFMKKLIIQGLIKMSETNLEVRILKRDEQLINSIKESCEEEFAKVNNYILISSLLPNVKRKRDPRSLSLHTTYKKVK